MLCFPVRPRLHAWCCYTISPEAPEAPEITSGAVPSPSILIADKYLVKFDLNVARVQYCKLQ